MSALKPRQAGQFHLRQFLAEEARLAGKALHHFTRLRVLLQQIVHVLHAGAAALGDAAAARTVDEHVVAALFGSHGVDDGDHAPDLRFVDLGVLQIFERADLRHHFQQAAERSEFADLFDLVAEVFERKIVAEQLLLHLLSGLLVDVLLDFVDQRQDIAHAQNARGNAVGMKGLERIGFFAHADEFQRLPGNGADRKRRAAAGIAIHLGKNDAGNAEALMELAGGLDRILAGHGVGDEQDFGRDSTLLSARSVPA